MDNLISCIIPVYRSKETLQECVKSILASTYSNFEILLILNGVDDGSGQVASELAKVDHRIKVFQSNKKGVSAARNLGIDRANGQFICFCDADDIVSDKWIERLLYSIEKHNSEMACCTHRDVKFDVKGRLSEIKYFYYLSEGLVSRKEYLVEINTPYTDNWGNIANVWSKIFRKSFLQKNNLRFNEEYVFTEDFDFVLKCMLCNPSIFILNENLYDYQHRTFITAMSSYQETVLETYTSNLEKCLEIVNGENYCATERNLIFSMLSSISIGGMVRLCRSDATISDTEIKEKLLKFISNPVLPEIYSSYRANGIQSVEIPTIALSRDVELLFETCRLKSKEKFGG